MKKIIKYNLIALLAMIFFLYSCDDEDNTGHSDLTATTPTITVSGINAGGYSLEETNTVFTFDVALSVAQISDVSLYVTQIDGNATAGEDFAILNSNSRVYIPANTTTGQLNINVLRDDLIEGVETFTLQIGDERTTNATVTPVTVTFTIGNYTDEELSIDMSWDTDVLDVIGLDLDPTEACDLRMLILDASDSSIVEVVDGADFENYSGMDTLADGNYLIATDIYSTIDVGDYNEILTLGVTLDFYQSGIYNNVILSYDGSFTNEYVCSSYRVYLASLSKLGDAYTFDKAFSTPDHFLAGEYQGIDTPNDGYFDESSQVEVILGCNLEIHGLGFNWIQQFWGEPIIAGGFITLDIDMTTGIITIPDQYYCTTTYEGAVQDDYNIFGSGTLDMSGEYPVMNIKYEMENYGVNWGDWSYVRGYIDTPTFEADITLDPEGFPAAKNSFIQKFDLNQKPVY